MDQEYSENMKFEDEVRRVAEAVWRLPVGGCQPEFYKEVPGLRELDGFVRLRDVTHLIMVTTSTKLEKLRGDVRKLGKAENIEKKTASAVSKWLITSDRLDAEHISEARKENVTVLTFDEFGRRFFDGKSYISLRERSPFGSARNLEDDSVDLSAGKFVSLPMRISGGGNDGRYVSLQDVAAGVVNGGIYVLRAPFGSGKSVTTRELFKSVSELYSSGRAKVVPVVINLRDHWGQTYFDEILERHARSIGYQSKEDLVIAWRAGMVCLLIDGFDEVASQTVVTGDKKNFMRQAREASLEGVRDFLNKMPSGVGVWICGRDHYFDDNREMIRSLGLIGKSHVCIKLEEFTEEAALEYLRLHGVEQKLPDWLPRKPLLLGYLVHKGLLEEVMGIDSSRGFGFAWDKFLDKITVREASFKSSVMDPTTVREVLGYLASLVRGRSSGVGPITGVDLSESYSIITRQTAGEGVVTQLQRLPGLTQREQDPTERSFVDEDLLAALQGEAFSSKALGMVSYGLPNSIAGLSRRAIAMAVHCMRKNSITSDTVVSLVARESEREGNPQFIADLFSVAVELALIEERDAIDFRGLLISGGDVCEINLEEISICGARFEHSSIDAVRVGPGVVSSTIKFGSCDINKVAGVSGEAALPDGIFDRKCEIGGYEDLHTNAAVVGSDLPLPIKALLTVLKKIYVQSGAGRRESALKRGVGSDVARYVTDVLWELEREGLIVMYNGEIVQPVRKQMSRVLEILDAPLLSSDPLVQKIRALK